MADRWFRWQCAHCEWWREVPSSGIGHLWPQVDRHVASHLDVSTFQDKSRSNALEMARKADAAERRAEDTEAAFERLRSAADKVGHQAVCPVNPCDCWMRDLVDALGGRGERWELVARTAQGAGDDAWDVSVFQEQDCDHHWLDRPESDTQVCEICGAEC